MKNQVLTGVSDLGAIGSLVLSTSDVESKLNCLFIIVSIVILCVNFGLRMYDRLKDGKLTKDEIKDTIDDVKEIKDEIQKGVEKHGDKQSK